MWSPLEYACHVRDVFRIMDTRLGLMLDSHDPAFENWDQDATAVEDDYRAQDPAAVAAELKAAAETFAVRYAGVGRAVGEAGVPQRRLRVHRGVPGQVHAP